MTVSDEFDGPEFLGEFVPYLAHRISSLMSSDIAPHLKEAGISLEMWRVLAVLSYVGDHNLVDLARATNVKTSTLSRLIGRMVDRKLVSRVRSQRDNRTVEVMLLDEGRKIVEFMTPHAYDIHDTAISGFSAEEAARLKSYLRRMYKSLLENEDKNRA